MSNTAATAQHGRFSDIIEERKIVARAESIEGKKMRASRVVHKPFDGTDLPPSRDHCIVYSIRQRDPVRRYYESSLSGVATNIRTTSILPAGRRTGWKMQSETEVLHLYLDDEVLREHINDTYDIDPTSVTLLDPMGTPDPYMTKLAQLVLPQIGQDSPTTRLMIDGFEQIVAAHLMTRYSSQKIQTERVYALKPATVSQVLDYMRANLENDLSLEDLAKFTSMSLYAFARAFKAATGTSPHQMLLAERVARAAEMLKTKDMKLAEIAYAVGFSSQSHMTTTFSKQLGVTPGRYRKDMQT